MMRKPDFGGQFFHMDMLLPVLLHLCNNTIIRETRNVADICAWCPLSGECGPARNSRLANPILRKQRALLYITTPAPSSQLLRL